MKAPENGADALGEAREETFKLLGAVSRYRRCAQMHLEVADDPVAIYDLAAARNYFVSAIRAYEPVRAAIRRDGAKVEGGEQRSSARSNLTICRRLSRQLPRARGARASFPSRLRGSLRSM